jgi:hypothetical protein
VNTLDEQEIESLVDAALVVFTKTPIPYPIPEMIGWKIVGNVIWVFTERDYRQDN